MTEFQYPIPLDATMNQKTHPGVHHRTSSYCSRDATPTGAVFGGASAAAASAGGAAPEGWRTTSHRMRPRSCRTPVIVRGGRQQEACGLRILHGFVTEVRHNSPRRDTLLKNVYVAFVLTFSRPGSSRLSRLTANVDLLPQIKWLRFHSRLGYATLIKLFVFTIFER